MATSEAKSSGRPPPDLFDAGPPLSPPGLLDPLPPAPRPRPPLPDEPPRPPVLPP